MKSKTASLLIWLCVWPCVAAIAQSEREFTDKVDNFKITLVGDWQPASYTDALGRQKTEFVFQSRAEGLLKITKEGLSGRSLANKIDNDLEDLKLRYACAYATQGPIKGLLTGTRVALYYFGDGRWTVGTYYYLQDGDSVWILRFTGRAGSPGQARDITDKMARSFCSVCGVQWNQAIALVVGSSTPRSTFDELRAEADEVISVLSPENFHAVGLWYESFPQLTDREVRGPLEQVAGQVVAAREA